MRVTSRSHARSQRLEEHAARMRHDTTASEARLFALLRGGQLGVAFRRQVPLLGRFIVDFLAPELRLVVEVDGAYHRSRQAADARRDRALVRAGYHVLRIDAELVMRDRDVAAMRMQEAVEQVRAGGT